jgi:hypothetical protein
LLDRFKTGPAATVAGALLLIVGGVVVVAHDDLAGTAIAFLGCLIVLRKRARQRKSAALANGSHLGEQDDPHDGGRAEDEPEHPVAAGEEQQGQQHERARD